MHPKGGVYQSEQRPRFVSWPPELVANARGSFHGRPSWLPTPEVRFMAARAGCVESTPSRRAKSRAAAASGARACAPWEVCAAAAVALDHDHPPGRPPAPAAWLPRACTRLHRAGVGLGLDARPRQVRVRICRCRCRCSGRHGSHPQQRQSHSCHNCLCLQQRFLPRHPSRRPSLLQARRCGARPAAQRRHTHGLGVCTRRAWPALHGFK